MFAGRNFYKIDLKTGDAVRGERGHRLVHCGDGLTYDEDGTLYAYVQQAAPAGGAAASSTSSLSTSTRAYSTSSVRSHTSCSAPGA